MKNFIAIFFISITLLCMNACNKNTADNNSAAASSNLYQYIPANASLVADINTEQLRTKCDWNIVKNSKAVNLLMMMAGNSLLRNIISDADNTGINFDGHLLACVNTGNTSDSAAITIICSVKDEKLIEASIKDLGNEIKKATNYSYSIGSNIMYAWNKNMIVITINKNQTELVPNTEKIFNIKKESSLFGTSTHFQNFTTTHNDIQIWVSNSSFMQGGMMKKMIPINDSTTLKMEGMYSINFNKGNIAATMQAYPNDDKTKELFKNFPQRKADMSMLNSLPDNLNGIITLSTDPEKCIDVVNAFTGTNILQQFQNKIDSSSEGVKINVHDIVKMLKGDIWVSIGNIQATNEDNVNEPNMLVAVSVNTDTAIYAAVRMLKTQHEVTQKDNIYEVHGNKSSHVFLSQKNNVLFIASTQQILNEAIDNNAPATKLNPDVEKLIGNNYGALYFNFDAIHDVKKGGTITTIASQIFSDMFINATGNMAYVKDDMLNGTLTTTLKEKEDWSINVILKNVFTMADSYFSGQGQEGTK